MKKYNLPSKSGKRFCDELWGKLVKLKYNSKCPICENLNHPITEAPLNPHHLISRRIFKYRWDVNNGLLVCPAHHKFDLYISAHTAPWGFEEWVKNNLPNVYQKWTLNRKDLENKEKIKYEEIYYNLEKQYKELTGEYYMIKRINMYLISLDKKEIKEFFIANDQKKAINQLCEKYNVSNNTIKNFLKSEKLI